jgi:hypothetical protein
MGQLLFLPQDKSERKPFGNVTTGDKFSLLTDVYNPTSMGLSVATFPDELLAIVPFV